MSAALTVTVAEVPAFGAFSLASSRGGLGTTTVALVEAAAELSGAATTDDTAAAPAGAAGAAGAAAAAGAGGAAEAVPCAREACASSSCSRAVSSWMRASFICCSCWFSARLCA